MASIAITLRGDEGNLLGQSPCYALNFGGHHIHTIEGAVELFKRLAMPDIEARFLEAAQELCIYSPALPEAVAPEHP
jgi:hypothetical protein